MTLKDFINISEFNEIRNAIAKEADFEFTKTVNKIEFGLKSHRVNDDYAENIWHGHHYLVFVDYARKYGNYMSGGRGMCTFEPFENWDKFKKWFNNLMKQYSEFEIKDEPEQLSLFEM